MIGAFCADGKRIALARFQCIRSDPEICHSCAVKNVIIVNKIFETFL